MRTLVRDARLLVTMDDGRRRLPGGWVLVEDATIAAMGAGEPPKDAAPHHTIDARGKVVLPGLVNTHHHLPQVLTRNVPRVICSIRSAIATPCRGSSSSVRRMSRPSVPLTRSSGAAIQSGSLI